MARNPLDGLIEILEIQTTYEYLLSDFERVASDGLHRKDCGEYMDARRALVQKYRETDCGKLDAQIAALAARLTEAEAALAKERERADRLEKVLDGVREEIHDKPTGLVHRAAFDEACSARDAALARVREVEEERDKRRAEFLWPAEDGSIEALGYEFANGRTEEYRREMWDALLAAARAEAVKEAFEWANGENSEFEVLNTRGCSSCYDGARPVETSDVVAAYLAQAGKEPSEDEKRLRGDPDMLARALREYEDRNRQTCPICLRCAGCADACGTRRG